MQHASDLDFDETGKHSDGHPTTMFYNVIALALFVITALEVAVLYPPLSLFGDYFKVILLVVLSVGKFIAVVAFFMHLYFDSLLLTFLFMTGMVIATGTVVALIHVMPEPTHLVKPKGKPAHHEPADHAFEHRMELWRMQRPG